MEEERRTWGGLRSSSWVSSMLRPTAVLEASALPSAASLHSARVPRKVWSEARASAVLVRSASNWRHASPVAATALGRGRRRRIGG